MDLDQVNKVVGIQTFIQLFCFLDHNLRHDVFWSYYSLKVELIFNLLSYLEKDYIFVCICEKWVINTIEHLY